MEFKVQKITKTVKITDDDDTSYNTTLEATNGYTKIIAKEFDECSFKKGELWSLKCVEEQKSL